MMNWTTRLWNTATQEVSCMLVVCVGIGGGGGGGVGVCVCVVGGGGCGGYRCVYACMLF